jgi:hypothetical protein
VDPTQLALGTEAYGLGDCVAVETVVAVDLDGDAAWSVSTVHLQSLDVLLDQFPDFLLAACTWASVLLLNCPERPAALQTGLVFVTFAIEAEQLQFSGWVVLELRLRTARFGVLH